MSRRRALAGALGPCLLAALAAASCLEGRTDRPLGSRCASDDECEASLVCEYGRCRSECVFDRDCPDGLACVAAAEDPSLRVCALPEEGGPDDCPGESRPSEGTCRDPCVVHEDCGDDRHCVDGFCVDGPPPSGIEGDSCEDAIVVDLDMTSTMDRMIDLPSYGEDESGCGPRTAHVYVRLEAERSHTVNLCAGCDGAFDLLIYRDDESCPPSGSADCFPDRPCEGLCEGAGDAFLFGPGSHLVVYYFDAALTLADILVQEAF